MSQSQRAALLLAEKMDAGPPDFDAIGATAQQKAAIARIFEQCQSETERIQATLRAERLKLLAPAESQRLRDEIDRDDWRSVPESHPQFVPSLRSPPSADAPPPGGPARLLPRD